MRWGFRAEVSRRQTGPLNLPNSATNGSCVAICFASNIGPRPQSAARAQPARSSRLQHRSSCVRTRVSNQPACLASLELAQFLASGSAWLFDAGAGPNFGAGVGGTLRSIAGVCQAGSRMSQLPDRCALGACNGRACRRRDTTRCERRACLPCRKDRNLSEALGTAWRLSPSSRISISAVKRVEGYVTGSTSECEKTKIFSPFRASFANSSVGAMGPAVTSAPVVWLVCVGSQAACRPSSNTTASMSSRSCFKISLTAP